MKLTLKITCFQVRVRSDHWDQFTMKDIVVIDSTGGKWKIEGYPFNRWTKYSTPWYKLKGE